VAVARGNEKDRVERAIRYVRDNFFATRAFADLDDLNVVAPATERIPSSPWRCQSTPASAQTSLRYRTAVGEQIRLQ
jgi:transposase